ncbi:RICIN domain-containing protein [Streptomyces sp. QTS52]
MPAGGMDLARRQKKNGRDRTGCTPMTDRGVVMFHRKAVVSCALMTMPASGIGVATAQDQSPEIIRGLDRDFHLPADSAQVEGAVRTGQRVGYVVKIQSRYGSGGQRLDADTNGGGNSTKAQVWGFNNTAQQSWFHPSGDLAIYNGAFYNGGNTVLDRNTNVPGDGAPVQLWGKNFQPQQPSARST